jgi:hypothetical protein
MLGQMAKPLRYWWYLIFALTASAVLFVTFGATGGIASVLVIVAATVVGWAIVGAVGAAIIYIVLRIVGYQTQGSGRQLR